MICHVLWCSIKLNPLIIKTGYLVVTIFYPAIKNMSVTYEGNYIFLKSKHFHVNVSLIIKNGCLIKIISNHTFKTNVSQ